MKNSMENLKGILETVAGIHGVYAGSRDKLGYILELVDAYTDLGINYKLSEDYVYISYTNGYVVLNNPATRTKEVFINDFLKDIKSAKKNKQKLLHMVSDTCYEACALPRILEGDPRVSMEIMECSEKLSVSLWVLEELLGGKWELTLTALGTKEANVRVEKKAERLEDEHILIWVSDSQTQITVK